jgi:hypothetical protein
MEQATETAVTDLITGPAEHWGRTAGAVRGSEMLSGGPEQWSNEGGRASAVQLGAGARVAYMPGCFARCVLVVAAGAIIAAQPPDWFALAYAQQAQGPSVSVASILRAEPASRVRLPIQVGPPGALPKNSFIRVRGLPPRHPSGCGDWVRGEFGNSKWSVVGSLRE